MVFEILLWLLYFTITIFIGVITASIIYARWHYNSLENSAGMPAVIRPYFIGGSDPFFYKNICCDEDIKRVRKYGRVFGVSFIQSKYDSINDFTVHYFTSL